MNSSLVLFFDFKKNLSSKYKKRKPRKAIVNQIQREQKKKWEIPEKAQKGISFIFSIQMDTHQRSNLMNLTGFSQLIDYSKLETKLSVAHVPGYFYVESKNPGVFGQDFAFIKNPGGDFLFLDLILKLAFSHRSTISDIFY